jgi:hypothetical protein
MDAKADNPQAKEQSPHPKLQALLPQLASIGPDSDNRPVFDDKSEARQYVRKQRTQEGEDIYLNPVWAIDHTDLRNSNIAGWSVTEYIN